ncbi:MAG: PhoPQ-activated pathogenicity-related family protein [Pirellulales bacterium]
MVRQRLSLTLLFLLFVGLVGGRAFAEAPPERTPLDDYVNAPDDSFSWKIVSTKEFDGGKAYVLDMTSQTWRSEDEVDRTKWQHWVTVAVPDKLTSNIGFMFIGGGSNGGNPPDGPNGMVNQIALRTGTVVAEVRMIPNQRLEFFGDGKKRSEDDLIAYTWVKYLETGDPTWPARNPMVKSVVRAMDAVTELLASDDGGNRVVDQFVVAGGSKRGWTTWLVGAVDDRVVGIAPIVIDVLNLEKSMGHHFAAYGFFAPSIGDYVEHKLVQQPKHPRLEGLRQLVDPYHYRHRLTMPKFIMNSAGDQFFPPDMSRFYFDDLEGEKYLRYVPNSDHGLDDTDAIESVLAFYSLILAGKDRPQFSWTQPDPNTFVVTTKDAPKEVRLWQATNPQARDFRLESLGPQYTSEVLEASSDGTYVAHVDDPPEGFTAFFVELTYDVDAPTPFKATTNVSIVPDVLPFADKNPTLPTSLTLHCKVPSNEVVEQIKQALDSPQMQAIGDDPRLTTSGEGDNLTVTLNWVPKGAFEDGARAIAGYLGTLGCDNFSFQMESGRPE